MNVKSCFCFVKYAWQKHSDNISRNRKKNDSLLLMVTKEHLAVSGCFPRAFHSFLSMFFQNISMALVKYPNVLRKVVQKLFGL